MGGSSSKLISDPSKLAGKQYDYVIIGGGTAGCVLASRLSEDPSVSVLVIEAGKSNAGVLFSQIPLAFPKLFKGPYDWYYETVPQPALGNRKLYWPRGKMLGGSSSINAVMYHQCAPEDFDEWGKLTELAPEGSPKWSYEILRPYFMKSENFKFPVALSSAKHPEKEAAKYAETSDSSHGLKASARRHTDVDIGMRGKGGPWQTSYGPYNSLCEDAIHAGEKIGIPYIVDFNTPKGTLGTSFFPGFVAADGTRSSAATAYLPPSVQARKNLTIAINCTVSNLHLSEDGLTVLSVEIARTPSGANPPAPAPSERWNVEVKKEAILSAGAVATPQILMLSGIGPKSELEKAGIKVIRENNNVGRNLIDHLVTTLACEAAPNTTLGYLDKPLSGMFALLKWLTSGGGIYSAIAVQSAAFIRMSDKSLPVDSGIPGAQPLEHVDGTSGGSAPDVELLYLAAPYINHGLNPPPKGKEVFTLASCLLRPQSRGTITLKSTNPYDHPIIDPNYLSSESDLNIHRKCVRLSMRLARQDPLFNKLIFPKSEETIDKSAANMFWPIGGDPDTITDEELREAVARYTETIYHPVSTARMGVDPTMSVVDTSLRVHGMKNLRIVDASIFPAQLSGHPTAPIIAIAERAAELIKGTTV